MAVSNSTDFNLTAAELVEEARRKIGIFGDEEPMEAQDLVTGLRQMNLMFKAWQADGVICGTTVEGQLALVAADVDYIFGAGGAFTTIPLEITDVRINRGGNDLPMFRLSREDYQALPNKTSQGYPTQYFYDRQRQGGVLYVWPAPDALGGTLKFTYRRIIMDVDQAVDDIDLPQEWYEAVIYNLADRLAENYGLASTPDGVRVAAKAAKCYAIVKNFDIGEGIGSISITPMGYEGRY